MSDAPGEEHGTFELEAFADELGGALEDREIGTTLWFQNPDVRVFELRLDPGERAPFHRHDRAYLWSVVEPGRGLQRFADGTFVVRDYAVGDSRVLEPSHQDPLVHDLENVGDSRLRFVTVEFGRDLPRS